MRAAIYARVSTDKQAEKYSIPAQKKLCAELCQRNGWRVVREFIDEGYSGSLFEDRPAFVTLLSFAEQKKIDVIVTTDSDRLARPDNLVDLGRLQKVLIANDVKLATLGGRVSDLSNSSDWFFSSLESLMAGWERKKIKERVKRGVKEKKLQGHFWGPVVPSGYIKQGTGKDLRLVPNPTRRELIGKKGNPFTVFSADEIKTVFNRYLSGESIKSIADSMDSHDTTLGYILDRAMFYAGYVLSMKDNGEVMGKGLHEPLISEFQAKKTLQLRGEKQKIHQDSRERYPSLGIIRCAICNAPLHLKVGMKPRKKYHYYTCSNKKLASIRHTTCSLPSRQVKDVEPQIWTTVEKIVTSPEVVFQMLSNSNAFKEQCRERLLRVEKELADLVQRKKRAMDLYEFANTQEEINDHRGRLTKLESDIQSKRKQRDEIEKDLRIQDAAPQRHREVLQTLEMLQEVVTEANATERREIVRLLFETILMHPDGQISYKLQIPVMSAVASPDLVSQKHNTESSFSMNCRSSNEMSLKSSGSRSKTGM